MKTFLMAVLVSTVLTFPVASATGVAVSKQECVEASDFIKNAAIGRENGMDGMTFTMRLLADFQAGQSFPPHVRWFAKTKRDEDFLIKEVMKVFGEPKEPETHQRLFLGECFAYIKTPAPR